MSLKNIINDRIDTYLEPFKNNGPTLVEFKNKTEQKVYFEVVYKSLTIESPFIEIIPPIKLRNGTIGFKVKYGTREQLFSIDHIEISCYEKITSQPRMLI